MVTFHEFLTEKLSLWDKVKKRYRQGSVSNRLKRAEDKMGKKYDRASSTIRDSFTKAREFDEYEKESNGRAKKIESYIKRSKLPKTIASQTGELQKAKNQADRWNTSKKQQRVVGQEAFNIVDRTLARRSGDRPFKLGKAKVNFDDLRNKLKK